MPGVLLRALIEYKFVGNPTWRMSDGKDLVRVELTFHKALPTMSYYKWRAESRRQPAPSAGELTRQPAPAARPTRRQTLVRRPPPCQEKETSLPSRQSLPDTPRQHIIHGCTQKTAIIQPLPIISRPPPATFTSLPLARRSRRHGRSHHQRRPTRRTVPATTASTSYLYIRGMTPRKSTTST